MDGYTGMILLYVLIGFFSFVFITGGIIILILWNRRKLIFTNFLNDSGQWERVSWKPDEIKDDSFIYDNTQYRFDIKKCTRDKINRPIAHYYKGNPEQQIFDYGKKNASLIIGNKEITPKDFRTLMLSKVLRDIFQDEEVMKLLWIIIIEIAIVGLILGILTATHNPHVVLKDDNETIRIIAQGVRQAISR